MSIPDKLDELTTALTEVNTEIIARLEGKRPSAEVAFEAAQLNGLPIEQHIQNLSGIFTPHVEDEDNPHGLTPADIEAYTTFEFDGQTINYLPSSIIPIERYGLSNYLKPNVNASTEGNSAQENTQCVMCLENDGTLVFLRNGRDSKSVGVYYSYLPNATGGQLGEVIHTQLRYAPSFLPPARRVHSIASVGDGCFICQLGDELDQSVLEWLLVITNGTMDANKHQCYSLQLNYVSGGVTQFTFNSLVALNVRVVKQGSKVYFIFSPNVYFGSTAGLSMSVFVFDTAGVVPSISQVTNFLPIGNIALNGGYGLAANYAGQMRFAATFTSTDALQNPLVHFPNESGTVHNIAELVQRSGTGSSIIRAAITNNVMRIYVGFPLRFIFGNDSATKVREFSLTLDLTTLQANYDDGLVLPVVVDKVGSSITYTGLRDTTELTDISLWDVRPFMLTKKDFVFTFTQSSLLFSNIDWVIKRHRLPEGVSIFDSLEVGSYTPVMSEEVPSSAFFPTNDRGGSRPATLFPDGIVTATFDENDQRVLLLTKVDFNSNFTHPGYADTIEYPGYALTDERVVISNDFEATTFHVEGTTITTYGTRFITSLSDTKFQTVGNDATWQGSTLTFSEANQLLFIQDCIALYNNGSFDSALIDITVPQDAALRPYGNVVLYNSGTLGFVALLVLFDVSSTTGQLDNWSNLTIATSMAMSGGANFIGDNFLNRYKGGPIIGQSMIYETDDYYLVRFISPFILRQLGGKATVVSQFAIDKATGNFERNSIGIAVNQDYIQNVSTAPFALPGLGFGHAAIDNNGLRTVFTRYTTDDTLFPANSGGTDVWVMTSTQPVENWTVYFGDEVPVLMNGIKGKLPITVIDLQTIDPVPANKTFYVYVEYVTGENAHYRYSLYLTRQYADSATMMFIGTVTTGASQVESTSINSVTRLSGYRLSTTADHGSIAVSQGLPMDETTLEWS